MSQKSRDSLSSLHFDSSALERVFDERETKEDAFAHEKVFFRILFDESSRFEFKRRFLNILESHRLLVTEKTRSRQHHQRRDVKQSL